MGILFTFYKKKVYQWKLDYRPEVSLSLTITFVTTWEHLDGGELLYQGIKE